MTTIEGPSASLLAVFLSAVSVLLALLKYPGIEHTMHRDHILCNEFVLIHLETDYGRQFLWENSYREDSGVTFAEYCNQQKTIRIAISAVSWTHDLSQDITHSIQNHKLFISKETT